MTAHPFIRTSRQTLLWILLFAVAPRANALTLAEYLDQVRKNNSTFASLEASKKAADNRSNLGDLELSPYLTYRLGYLDDQKIPATAMAATRTQAFESSAALAKRFATGTQVALTFVQQRVTILGLPPTVPVYPSWTNTFGVAVEQSLLKNGFGSGTRARRLRESVAERLERLSLEAQSRQALVDAESAYWDLSFQSQDLEKKKESLERAERLMGWMDRRAANGLGDRNDVLQIRALLDRRRLEVVDAADNLLAARQRVADYLQLPVSEVPSRLGEDELSRVRQPPELVGRMSGDPVRVDSLIKQETAQLKAAIARESSLGLRPDLSIQGSFATNARDASYGSVVGDSLDADKPTWGVGVKLSIDLDFRGQSKARSVSDYEAQAAELQAQRANFESRSSWSELNRRHKELSARLVILERLAKTQADKAIRERERLGQGRTITSQVTQFEQDASDAQVLLLQLRAQQRKLEASSTLFISSDQGVPAL